MKVKCGSEGGEVRGERVRGGLREKGECEGQG